MACDEPVLLGKLDTGVSKSSHVRTGERKSKWDRMTRLEGVALGVALSIMPV